ncbi:polyprenyl synthetase family protein [Streptomyces sp. NRRL S-118]|uniref:polyprenyl synthetase family protein n=1 Tax=Streptomyces sp. NRRL S-118 TaxID=1463881 RepID=UPI0006940CD1|nr:polyprenyl synthetase family protein [Streptomyces sp. NRRL S-118]
MLEALSDYYAKHLAEIDQLVNEELARWPWQDVPEMEKLIRAQLRRKGKRLRPLLMFTLADLVGGDPWRVVPGATGVELYHLASLVLDDIQDNSAYRRGVPAVHTTSGVSTALNLAGVIRALSFQPLHRSPGLDPAEKRRVDGRVGTATMHLYLGQSIDIGWHDGWYPGIGDYPYKQMAEWKTGAMFGCAAWIATFVSGAPEAVVESADRFGTKAGVLYQLVDDYLDIFGSDGVLRRPALEDLRGGKPSWPLIALCRVLRTQGEQGMADLVVQRLRQPDARDADWGWLLALTEKLDVAEILRQDLERQARELTFQARELASSGGSTARVELFIQVLLRSAAVMSPALRG